MTYFPSLYGNLSHSAIFLLLALWSCSHKRNVTFYVTVVVTVIFESGGI